MSIFDDKEFDITDEDVDRFRKLTSDLGMTPVELSDKLMDLLGNAGMFDGDQEDLNERKMNAKKELVVFYKGICDELFDACIKSLEEDELSDSNEMVADALEKAVDKLSTKEHSHLKAEYQFARRALKYANRNEADGDE